MKYPKDYITHAKNRETYDLSMSSGHELAYGICKAIYPKLDRNKHLWCYSTIALEKVEDWLKIINVDKIPNFRSFKDFEELYEFVNQKIGGIKGIGDVEIYDVALYLGERMSPQVIPMTNVYVHGKLVEAARHYLSRSGRKVPRSLHKIKVEDFGSIYSEIADSPYAARAIEEWLCNEHDEVMKL